MGGGLTFFISSDAEFWETWMRMRPPWGIFRHQAISFFQTSKVEIRNPFSFFSSSLLTHSPWFRLKYTPTPTSPSLNSLFLESLLLSWYYIGTKVFFSHLIYSLMLKLCWSTSGFIYIAATIILSKQWKSKFQWLLTI